MRSPEWLEYRSLTAWAIGSSLIVSVALRPEMAFQVTGYMADLFSGELWSAPDALIWLLMAVSGLGLLALRRWACFLVYIAFLYSLVPYGPDFPVFPVTPILTELFNGQILAGRLSVHFLNVLFVSLVVSVHVSLAKTAAKRYSRRADIAVLVASMAALALLVTAGAVVLLASRQQFMLNTVSLPAVTAYLILLGVPVAVWSGPAFVLACVRLIRRPPMRYAIRQDIDDAVGYDEAAIATPHGADSTSQFTLRFLFLAVTFVSVVVALAVLMRKNANDPRRYQWRFDAVTAWADRIVVRDGGFDCCGPVDDQRILFEVTDVQELEEVRKHIQLVPETPDDGCMCCGYPGIDWYRGTRRLALTGFQHGAALRWRGFPMDARLTTASAEWMVTWLVRHGVSTEAADEETTITREARRILGQYVPSRFREALTRTEAESQSPDMSQQIELKDSRVRAAFADEKTMYSALFRVLGCLTMRWDSWYEPEQGEAFDFLTRAPREEIERAILLAAHSDDPVERRGAARVVFSQFSMTSYGKTKSNIAAWMAYLDDEAFADPLPANRRMVLQRLTEYHATDLHLLERAVSDPDQTVRHKAIKALTLDGSPNAVAILQRVAAGQTQQPTLGQIVTDYGQGTGNVLNTSEMDEERYSESDVQMAFDAIQAIVDGQKKVGR